MHDYTKVVTYFLQSTVSAKLMQFEQILMWILSLTMKHITSDFQLVR